MKNFIILCALFISACSFNKQCVCTTGNQRTFQFTYEVELDPTNGKKLEVWLPVPQSDEVQTITNLQFNTAGLAYSLKDEHIHGNKYLYIHEEMGIMEAKKIQMVFNVKRQEHKNVNYEGVDPGSYLKPYSTVPTGAVFSKIISEKKLSKDNVRGIFDHVLSGMHYGKPKSVEDSYYQSPWLHSDSVYGRKGVDRDEVVSLYQKAELENSNYTFGNGNSIYACDIGVGNCTDYHSYFMSLARTLNIPARFHMGFPIPVGDEGQVGGYHCWADYYAEGEGWFPIDISEADKNPQKKDYFFGTICENRVDMMIGRDFILEGYEDGFANLFIYPLMEISDEKSTAFTKRFTFKNL